MKLILHKDIQQQTDKWFEIKKLKMSASHANTIIANGKGLTTYVNELIADYFSTGERENYTNENMERGNLLEEQARVSYELANNCTVEQVGFIEVEGEYFGISPDGLVGDDGGLEIKNHTNRVFIELLLSGEIDKKYYDQIQMSLFTTGRKWWDYLGYNPNIAPYQFVKRITPDSETFEKLKKGLATGKQTLLETKTKIEAIAGVKCTS